ncbi:MAG: peptidoglycan DD-metalloendopeptidase family protein [Thiotrichales bacterium]
MIFVASVSLLSVVLAKTHESLTKESTTSATTDATDIVDLISDTLPPADYEDATPHDSEGGDQIAGSDGWVEVIVSKGDTLSTIFSKLGILDSLKPLLDLKASREALNVLIPGETLRLRTEGTELLELIYATSETSALHVVREGDSLSASTREVPIETRVTHVTSRIEDSLFGSGKREGLSDNMIMRLVELFEFDIDFALDIRVGDRFSVIYEERYADGQRLKDGPILAAEFENQGNNHRAFFFTSDGKRGDYYTEDGKNLRKSFVRTPLKFTRISSLFNPTRMHPVLHKIRAHKGVDYAAPVGTPVRATADGVVATIEAQRGYGNVIVLEHWDTYTTLYAHLSRFAPDLKKGGKVKQGDVIGYVGRTGMATGPHLHYEFRINGQHKDPLTVQLPREPLTADALKQYRKQISPLVAQLDLTKVASAR